MVELQKIRLPKWFRPTFREIVIGVVIGALLLGIQKLDTLRGSSHEITISNCSTLRTNAGVLTGFSADQQVDINPKFLNEGFVLIQNSGSEPLENVEIYVYFEGENDPELLYLDVGASSLGLLKAVHDPVLSLEEKLSRFKIAELIPKEYVLIELGFDDVATLHTEVRNKNIATHIHTFPGCSNSDDFIEVYKHYDDVFFGTTTYLSDNCALDADGRLSCTITSVSDNFEITEEDLGKSIKETRTIEMDPKPIDELD